MWMEGDMNALILILFDLLTLILHINCWETTKNVCKWENRMINEEKKVGEREKKVESAIISWKIFYEFISKNIQNMFNSFCQL